MKFTIEAACGCSTGRVRKNNEDNFYFDGKCLERENRGLRQPAVMEGALKSGLCMAVFDGMGGENFGEYASYTAARQLQQAERSLGDFWVPAKKYLSRLTDELNDAVIRAQQEMVTERMGSTMSVLYFWGKYVYTCNVGDSRAYRLRNGEFLQISEDHVEKRPGRENRKAPLTQYLGINSEEIQIEPYIAKGELQTGDLYLLCSDGLTDMLTNFEIADIMLTSSDAQGCAENLIQAALAKGGRDNVTVIVCMIRQ